MVPPSHYFIICLIVIILAFISNIISIKNSQKAKRYKRELDLLKHQYHLDEPDSNFTKTTTSVANKATSATKPKEDGQC